MRDAVNPHPSGESVVVAVVGVGASMIGRCIQLDTSQDWSGLGRLFRVPSGSGDQSSRSPDDCSTGQSRFLSEPPVEGSVRELVSGPEAPAAGNPVS